MTQLTALMMALRIICFCIEEYRDKNQWILWISLKRIVEQSLFVSKHKIYPVLVGFLKRNFETLFTSKNLLKPQSKDTINSLIVFLHINNDKQMIRHN